jgi:sulfur carrier protein ThiS
MPDGLQVLIQLIDERNTRRDVEVSDGFVGDVVEILDQGTERIAVSGNEHLLASLDIRNNDVIVIRNDTGNGILQGFMQRQNLRIDAFVLLLIGRIALISDFQSRRGNIERTTPLMDLLGTILG